MFKTFEEKTQQETGFSAPANTETELWNCTFEIPERCREEDHQGSFLIKPHFLASSKVIERTIKIKIFDFLSVKKSVSAMFTLPLLKQHLQIVLEPVLILNCQPLPVNTMHQ